jgi:hypothetical protein
MAQATIHKGLALDPCPLLQDGLAAAEKCRGVAPRISLITASAGFRAGPDVWFIFVPQGHDGSAILLS